MQIKLAKSLAQALIADIVEIQQLKQIGDSMMVRLADRANANKRLTDAIVRDAGYDPALFARYNIEDPDANGDVFMTLIEANVNGHRGGS